MYCITFERYAGSFTGRFDLIFAIRLLMLLLSSFVINTTTLFIITQILSFLSVDNLIAFCNWVIVRSPCFSAAASSLKETMLNTCPVLLNSAIWLFKIKLKSLTLYTFEEE